MKKGLISILVLATGLGTFALLRSSESQVQPFSCEALQARTEICAPQILTRVAEEVRAQTKKDVADHSEEQIKMFEYRAKKKVQDKKTEKQCLRFKAAQGTEYARRIEGMKTCFSKPDCDGFSKCLLGL